MSNSNYNSNNNYTKRAINRVNPIITSSNNNNNPNNPASSSSSNNNISTTTNNNNTSIKKNHGIINDNSLNNPSGKISDPNSPRHHQRSKTLAQYHSSGSHSPTQSNHNNGTDDINYSSVSSPNSPKRSKSGSNAIVHALGFNSPNSYYFHSRSRPDSQTHSNSGSGSNTPNRKFPRFQRQRSNPDQLTQSSSNTNNNSNSTPNKGPRSWRNQEANLKEDLLATDKLNSTNSNGSNNSNLPNAIQTPRFRPPNSSRTKNKATNVQNTTSPVAAPQVNEFTKRWLDVFQRFTSINQGLQQLTVTSTDCNSTSSNRLEFLKKFHKLIDEIKNNFTYPVPVNQLKTDIFNSSIISTSDTIDLIVNNQNLFVIHNGTEDDTKCMEKYYVSLSSYYQLMSSLVLKKQLQIETINEKQAEILMKSILNCAKQIEKVNKTNEDSNNNTENNTENSSENNTGYCWLRIDCLRFLSHVLFENGKKFKTFKTELLDLLLPPLNIDTHTISLRYQDENVEKDNNYWVFDIEFRRMAINAIGNFCIKSEKMLLSSYPAIYNAIFLLFSKGLLQAKQNSKYNSILASILRALNSILPDLFVCFPTNSKLKANGINISSLLVELRKVFQWGLPFFQSGLSTSIHSIANTTSGRNSMSMLESIGETTVIHLGNNPNTNNNVNTDKRRLSVHATNTQVNVAAAAFSPSNFPLFNSNNNTNVISDVSVSVTGTDESSLFSGLYSSGSGPAINTNKFPNLSAMDNELEDEETQSSSSNSALPPGTSTDNESDYPLIGRSSKQSQARKAKEFELLTGEKVRNSALQCIHTISRCCSKLDSNDYSNLIPTDNKSAISSRPFSGPHLLTVILFDPSNKVRTIAATALSTLLAHFITNNSQLELQSKFKSVNQGNNPKDQLISLHEGLYQAITNEQQFSVAHQILKSISVLVNITPYEIIQNVQNNASATGRRSSVIMNPPKPKQLLVPIITYLITHLLHDPSSYTASSHNNKTGPNSTTKVNSMAVGSVGHVALKFDLRHAVFSCLSQMFDTSSSIAELSEYLTSSSTSSNIVQLIPILIAHAKTRRPTDPTPDAYFVLSKIARHYKFALSLHWNWSNRLNKSSLSELILFALYNSNDYSGKLVALKIIEEWTKIDISVLNDNVTEDFSMDTNENNPSENNLFFSMSGIKELYGEHFTKLYKSHFALVPSNNTANTNENNRLNSLLATIRCKIVTCLSYMPFSLYTSFNENNQNEFQELSISAASSSVTSIRAASCRCLGLFSLYCARLDQRNEHNQKFCVNAINLLIKLASIQESVIVVRTKAVWALANLCDYTNAITPISSNNLSSEEVKTGSDQQQYSSNRPFLYELVPASTFLLLLRSLIESAHENEKIAANGVRALGNILKWIPFTDSTEINYVGLWSEVVETLLAKLKDTKTSVKTRWNCCYAVGNMMKNFHLPQILQQNAATMQLLGKSFECLLELLDINNSKLRPPSSPPSNNNNNNNIQSDELLESKSPVLTVTSDRKLPTKSEIKFANNNFKVRINSVVALSSPLSYAHFGVYYCKILSELLDYFTKVESLIVMNPREKTYRTTLKTQLTASIMSLLNKLNVEIQDSKLLDLLVNKLTMLARLLFEERISIEKQIRTAKFRSIQNQTKRNQPNEQNNIPATLLSSTTSLLQQSSIITAQRTRASFSFLSSSSAATSASTAVLPDLSILDTAQTNLLAIYKYIDAKQKNTDFSSRFTQLTNGDGESLPSKAT